MALEAVLALWVQCRPLDLDGAGSDELSRQARAESYTYILPGCFPLCLKSRDRERLVLRGDLLKGAVPTRKLTKGWRTV